MLVEELTGNMLVGVMLNKVIGPLIAVETIVNMVVVEQMPAERTVIVEDSI